MKTNNKKLIITLTFLACLGWAAQAEDLEFYGGVTAELTSTVEGNVWVYDANVAMYEPAHIKEFLITTSGAVVDIYGGKIDYMLVVTTSQNEFPEAEVTIYGTDFMVDGVPVEPGTPEVFLSGQTLSGTYVSGTPFSFMVDCILMGNGQYIYYQTVKLGWLVSEPDIELDRTEVDFGQTEIGSMKQESVTIQNVGDAALNIQSISLIQQDEVQFDLDSSQVYLVTLEPNAILTVDVSYFPAVEGLAEAVLEIVSDDPNESVVEVALIGEGVPMPPEKQIALILDLFKQGVEDNSIQGTGNKRCAYQKLRTFERMLKISQRLIDAGYDDYAACTLKMVESKCDGQKRPNDFIEGDGVAELNALINKLIDTLHNQ